VTAERAERRAARKYARRVSGTAVANQRRCRACKRGAATGKPVSHGDNSYRKCRYCGFWNPERCDCMVETDEHGVERVVTHSRTCPEYLAY
jgi:hypothetical protein